MKKWLQKRLKNEKGLTLVELLAVIVILGIIAAIAIPAIGNIVENSRVKAIKADALMVLSAADMYFIDNPDSQGEEVTVATLKEEGFLDDEASFAGEGSGAVTYNANANQFNGTGKNGNVTITFTNATKASINSATDVENNGTISGTATGGGS